MGRVTPASEASARRWERFSWRGARVGRGEGWGEGQIGPEHLKNGLQRGWSFTKEMRVPLHILWADAESINISSYRTRAASDTPDI